MSECERFESYFDLGEPGEQEREELREHCRTCKSCADLLALHGELTELGQDVIEPDSAELAALHRRVLGELASEQQPHASSPWQTLVSGHWFRGFVAAAASLVLFVAGLAVGRGGGQPAPINGNGGVMARLVGAIHADAAFNRTLPDVEDSRFTYSNVSFRPVEGGRVALDFDITTHIQLVESVDSEVVQDVLVHALLDPSSTGARLKAMSYAGAAMDSKVKDALIFALRRDDNLAVRLKALTILSDHLTDQEIESAVLATLQDDESVQMRLLALDYLAAHSEDRSRIQEVIQNTDRPGTEALKVRLAEYGT